MHEETEAESSIDILGASVDGISGRVCPTHKRRWRLCLALRWAGRRPRVTGQEIERLIGQVVFVVLANRFMLSILRHVYDFIRDSYTHRQRLWASAAHECCVLAGLVPLLGANLRLHWHPRVTSIDACPTEMGVAECDWFVSDVCRVGR